VNTLVQAIRFLGLIDLQLLFKLLFVLAAVPFVAVGQQQTDTVKSYQYTVPEKTNDGWETAHLSTENIDAELVNDLFNRVIDQTYKNIHSVLIIRNGRLVVEEYFPGGGSSGQYHAFKRDTLHGLNSVTKSIGSILIGIAIDQHLISGVEQNISSFFPEYSDIFADSAKPKIRLSDCLSMTAGLEWNEWNHPYTDSRNDHIMMNRSNDPVRYVLERPVVETPGTKFVYNSGISITMGQIIYKVSGLRADRFAGRYLFAPLGISEYSWWKYPNGVLQTGGGLSLRPRDMAKIGSLFLNGGRWQGKQIVSEEWVQESTKQRAPDRDYGYPWWAPAFLRHITYDPPTDHNEYGYQWWVNTFHVRGRDVAAYSAQGRGGQFIFVVPKFQMVAVFTGWNDNSSWDQPFYMMEQYILPAVVSGGY